MTEIIKDRSMIDDKYKWDLTKIYKTNADFESDCKKVKNLITEYRKKYENHTMDNAKIFYDSIVDEIEIERLLEKLYSYSNLKKDEDVANTENQELRSKVVNLYDYASKNMFFTSTEMLKKDYSLIEEFYKEEPRLLEHENNLKDSFRYKKYMLSDEEEKLLSNISKAFGNDEETYGYLVDSDMTFGEIKDENGNMVELTDTNYSVYIESKNRSVRKAAFESLYNHYKQFKNTITSLFNGSINESVSMAKLRGYPSAFLASLYKDDKKESVYNTLVDTIHNNLDVYQKYYELKKEVLNLDELHLYDIYTPMIDEGGKKYSFEEAKEMVLNALSVLGDDYINNFKKIFDEKWVDIYPNKNKRAPKII